MNFDSKGKRKVGQGQQIVIVAENASAALSFDLIFALRMLSMVSGT